MSKRTYIECDICGQVIGGDGLTTRIKGERRFPFFADSCKVDICGNCINKIAELVNKEKEA